MTERSTTPAGITRETAQAAALKLIATGNTPEQARTNALLDIAVSLRLIAAELKIANSYRELGR